MRALALLVAALAIAGCDDAAKCPEFPYNDVPCSTEGMTCKAATRGSCTCEGGSWFCPGDYPVPPDMAVRDLSIRDLAPQPGD